MLQITSLTQLQELFTPEQILQFLDGTSLRVAMQMRARALMREFGDFDASDWLTVYFIEVICILLDDSLSPAHKDAAIQSADLPEVHFGTR